MAYTAADVAEAILAKTGAMSAMKLQKLLYYCQAWFLVWEDAPLFDDRIEAWANGPVLPSVYEKHRGYFTVQPGWFAREPQPLHAEAMDAVGRVLDFYSTKSAQWLSDLTHIEDPWVEARRGLDPDERSNREITLEAMGEYYSSL